MRRLALAGKFLLFAAATGAPVCAQRVRVDLSPGRAIAFDPDKALGSSMDILPAREFDTVYTDAVIKESLSAGWGPITYRQNTELTIDAWHWNPDGKWSNEKEKSGYLQEAPSPEKPCAGPTAMRCPIVAQPGATRGTWNFRG
jgi:hypothetical protein